MEESLLGSLDLTKFHDYIDCVKAEIVNAFKENLSRNQNILKLIQYNVCQPFGPLINLHFTYAKILF